MNIFADRAEPVKGDRWLNGGSTLPSRQHQPIHRPYLLHKHSGRLYPDSCEALSCIVGLR